MPMIQSNALGNAAATALEIVLPVIPAVNRRVGILRWARTSNLDTVPAWLIFYQQLAADVTPGVDRVGVPIFVPRLVGQEAPVVIPIDMIFSPVLSIFAATSSTGTGVPLTGVRVELEWQRLS